MRVLVVDDHAVVRTGIAAMIDAAPDLEVVGEAGTAEDAVRRVGFDQPDVVVLDVRLPDGSGVEACRRIRERFPEVRVLILTSFADEQALMSAIVAGASGYVLKNIKGNDLVESIRRVGAGESLLDTAMTERLFLRIRGGEPDPLLARLSAQERRVLDFLAQGMTNRQIGEEMYLAEKTIKNYVSNVLTKLGMSTRTEAATYAGRGSRPRAPGETPPRPGPSSGPSACLCRHAQVAFQPVGAAGGAQPEEGAIGIVGAPSPRHAHRHRHPVPHQLERRADGVGHAAPRATATANPEHTLSE